MRSQQHNKGELKELVVKIERSIVESIETMSKRSGMSVDEIVVVALKRFRSSHADYEGKTPDIE